MAAKDLGNRLTCGACGARFYDLHRSDPVCPKCKTPYGGPARPARPARAVIAAVSDEYDDAEELDEELDDETDEDEEDDDGVEELDLDSDHILPAIGGTDDDEEEGDPALDELDEAELPDDSFADFGDDD